jgi:3-oxoacyl-[acyl-carrier protein] reductase
MPDFSNKLLSNKVAVVTGGSRGIGKAIALEFASQGAKIVVNYVHSASKAEEVVETIKSMGGSAIAVQANISDFEQAGKLIETANQTYEKIDILVNNAGITRDKLIMRMSEEDWDDVQNINLKGTFNCSKATVKLMMRKRFGRIINITSVSGQIGNAGQTNYSASKAGQIGFTKALAKEVAVRNITVNAIAAGYIDTEIWDDVPDEGKQAFLELIPLKRKGTPEEIAYMAAFLASDKASYITGQVIAIDGGLAMF